MQSKHRDNQIYTITSSFYINIINESSSISAILHNILIVIYNRFIEANHLHALYTPLHIA